MNNHYQELHIHLEIDRAKIFSQLSQIKNHIVSGEIAEDDLFGGTDDAAAHRAEMVNLLAQEETLGARLSEVDAALSRMENGSYGVCCECGDEIPLGRLSAVPCAKLCLACKNKQPKYATDRI